jgi:hypothetical protein
VRGGDAHKKETHLSGGLSLCRFGTRKERTASQETLEGPYQQGGGSSFIL